MKHALARHWFPDFFDAQLRTRPERTLRMVTVRLVGHVAAIIFAWNVSVWNFMPFRQFEYYNSIITVAREVFSYTMAVGASELIFPTQTGFNTWKFIISLDKNVKIEKLNETVMIITSGLIFVGAIVAIVGAIAPILHQYALFITASIKEIYVKTIRSLWNSKIKYLNMSGRHTCWAHASEFSSDSSPQSSTASHCQYSGMQRPCGDEHANMLAPHVFGCPTALQSDSSVPSAQSVSPSHFHSLLKRRY